MDQREGARGVDREGVVRRGRGSAGSGPGEGTGGEGTDGEGTDRGKDRRGGEQERRPTESGPAHNVHAPGAVGRGGGTRYLLPGDGPPDGSGLLRYHCLENSGLPGKRSLL